MGNGYWICKNNWSINQLTGYGATALKPIASIIQYVFPSLAVHVDHKCILINKCAIILYSSLQGS